jgi:tRNA pseudouridine(55) synthase
MKFIINKKIGETPLECLERVRLEQEIAADVPMTYAGRLDPLASGKLLILVGEECKDKEKYLDLDKEYEIEVLFGVGTDTGDALGLVTQVYPAWNESMTPDHLSKGFSWSKFCGKFTQVYPAFSSKTVVGRQLHSLARSGELPDEMPTKEVEIYSIEEIGKGEQPVFMSGKELAEQAVENVLKVKGDFRQKEIISGWNKFDKENGDKHYFRSKLCVSCSSGTYMRSLAERIGKEAGTVAFAFSIERTKVGEF